MKPPAKKLADLIVTNGILLPLSPGFQSIAEGAIAIQGNQILALGPKKDVEENFTAPQFIDAAGGLIMPGLINAHTHAAMSLFRGMADDLPLKTWLEEYIFPAERKWVNEEFVYWGALLSCAEMIRSGTSTFADGYFFAEQVAQAASHAGLRALVAQGVLDFPTPDSSSPAEALEKAETLMNTYSGSDLIRPTLFAHSPLTCSPSLLRRCRDMTRQRGIPLMIHVAETRGECEEMMQRYGRRPVEYLENLGLLSPSLIACHCVWLTEAEMDLLAWRGVKTVHNPESNMKLASGVAPIPELLTRGVTVGLGTDGCASNNNLDMFQEMDFAAKLHKVHRLDPTVMSAQEVLQMATWGGAKVLGLEKEIGSLEVGKKADIIIMDLYRPHLQPLYHIVSHLVYSATGADVRDMIINGRLIMQNHKLLTLNEDEIFQKVTEWIWKIKGTG